MEFFIWSSFYFCVVFAASLMVGVRRNERWLKLLTLPGLLVYSACRALGCLASCTRVEKFGVLRAGEPFVRLGATRMAYVGHVVGIVVTHAALLACVFLAQELIGVEDWAAICLPAFSASVTYPPTLLEYLRDLPSALPWDHAGFWFALYLCAAVCCNFELSVREFAAGLCVTVTAAWICGMLAWLGVRASFLSWGWLILHYRVPGWLGIASFYLLAVSGAAVVVAATLGWTHGSRSYKHQIEKSRPSSRVSSREREKELA